ncbi:MAG: LamG-like jellyroll fold domain-containing protein [Bacteroidota bacterium]
MRFFYLCLFLTYYLLPQGVAQVDENLVGHFTFDDPAFKSPTHTYRNVQVYGEPQLGPGVLGKALYFDGNAHEVYFPDELNYFMEGQWPFSLSFYFRSGDLRGERSLMGKRRRCDGERMFDISVGRNITVQLSHRRNGSRTCNVSAPIPDRGWHHYTYVRKPNAAFLFIDGKLADYKIIGQKILLEQPSLFSINASPCKDVGQLGQLRGAIDDLKIYYRALAPDEIWWFYRTHRSEQQRANEKPIFAPSYDMPSKRLQQIFGTYNNIYAEVKSELQLDTKRFVLTIEQPRQYNQARQLTFSGKYRIEAGQLYLIGDELLLTQADGGQQRQPYDGPPLIGSLYGQVSIDLNAFDERMTLQKN